MVRSYPAASHLLPLLGVLREGRQVNSWDHLRRIRPGVRRQFELQMDREPAAAQGLRLQGFGSSNRAPQSIRGKAGAVKNVMPSDKSAR
jgi:hypothetical protein